MTKQPPSVSSIGVETDAALAVKEEMVPKTGESAMTHPEPMIVDSTTGEAHPIGSITVFPSGPVTESNDMEDETSMGNHSMTEGETDTVHDSGVLSHRPACPRDPMILTLRDQSAPMNPSLDRKTADGRIGRLPLCRMDVRIGEVLVNACVTTLAVIRFGSYRLWR